MRKLIVIIALMCCVATVASADVVGDVWNDTYTLISKGRDEGIRMGDVFPVYRDGKLIGAFTIEKVEKDLSVGAFHRNGDVPLALTKGDVIGFPGVVVEPVIAEPIELLAPQPAPTSPEVVQKMKEAINESPAPPKEKLRTYSAFNFSTGALLRQDTKIAKVAAWGFGVKASAVELHVGGKAEPFTWEYARHIYSVKKSDITGKTTDHPKASIVSLQYTPEAIRRQYNASVSGMMYADGDNTFGRTQVSAEVGRGDIKSRVGLQWYLGNDSYRGTSFFGDIRWNVSNNVALFAEYNSRDYRKLIMNRYLLSPLGVDCSSCSKDALDMGLRLNTGPLRGTFGMLDVAELKTLFGDVSLNWNF